MTTSADLVALLEQLSEENLAKVREYVEYLQQQAADRPARSGWSFDFIEHFPGAECRAERDPAGMEIKIGEATCGGDARPALWEHPPASGAAQVMYVVPFPANLRGVKLRFAIGIRDGAQLPSDRYVAFRVKVNDWQLWSVAKNSHAWDEYEVQMPELASDVARIQFMTDGLGDHRWNWAVWARPQLVADVVS